MEKSSVAIGLSLYGGHPSYAISHIMATNWVNNISTNSWAQSGCCIARHTLQEGDQDQPASLLLLHLSHLRKGLLRSVLLLERQILDIEHLDFSCKFGRLHPTIYSSASLPDSLWILCSETLLWFVQALPHIFHHWVYLSHAWNCLRCLFQRALAVRPYCWTWSKETWLETFLLLFLNDVASSCNLSPYEPERQIWLIQYVPWAGEPCINNVVPRLWL